ncbi:unnamed protein product [Brassica rapa subsp. trilocularis]
MSRMVMSKLNDKPEEIELLHPALGTFCKTIYLLQNFTDLMLKEHQLRTPSSGLICMSI